MLISELPHRHSENFEEGLLHEALGKTEDFKTAAEIIGSLGDPTRLRIFWLLCHCEECVLNIAAMLDMSSPAVSHHLRILKDSKLVVSERKGKEVIYTAADSPITKLLHSMIEKVIEISCPEEN